MVIWMTNGIHYCPLTKLTRLLSSPVIGCTILDTCCHHQCRIHNLISDFFTQPCFSFGLNTCKNTNFFCQPPFCTITYCACSTCNSFIITEAIISKCCIVHTALRCSTSRKCLKNNIHYSLAGENITTYYGSIIRGVQKAARWYLNLNWLQTPLQQCEFLWLCDIQII